LLPVTTARDLVEAVADHTPWSRYALEVSIPQARRGQRCGCRGFAATRRPRFTGRRVQQHSPGARATGRGLQRHGGRGRDCGRDQPAARGWAQQRRPAPREQRQPGQRDTR
jgi:hypothetical protein